MASNISAFPDRKGADEDIYCETMDIRFPPVYRLEAENEVSYGLSHQAHHRSGNHTEFLKAARVCTLRPQDQYSVIVRWHPSFDASDRYLMSL